MSLEEKVKKVREGFEQGTSFDFGFSSPSETVDFEFPYSGEIPIQGVQAACSCTNLRVEDGFIRGTLSLSAVSNYSKQQSNYMLDAEDRIWVVQGKVAVPTDSGLKPVPLNVLKAKPLPIEQKTFTVFFDDGEEFKIVDENKVVRENENKTKLQLIIKGFVKL